LRRSLLESIEESAAKFQEEAGRWEEEILRWAYRSSALAAPVLRADKRSLYVIARQGMPKQSPQRGRIMRLLRFARNDSKG
jgi:hypothetical protein